MHAYFKYLVPPTPLKIIKKTVRKYKNHLLADRFLGDPGVVKGSGKEKSGKRTTEESKTS